MVGLTPVSDSWDVGGEEKTVYGQVEEATVTSLRPATLYHIRLFAENELGRSKEGRVLQVGAVQYTILQPPSTTSGYSQRTSWAGARRAGYYR